MFVLIGLRAAKINLFSCVIGLLCLFGSGVLSQELEDSLDPDEQTFVEIKLTPEGVIAFDSSGKTWRWDFNSESFKPRRGNWRYSEAPPVDQPIEARATNEKHINDSEKRVVVEFDEYVKGDIITSGKVTIRGWVKGSIRSFDRVLIAESGRVEGDIRAPRVIVKEGGLVIGEIDESSPLTDLPKVIGETISMAGLWVLFGFAIFLTVTGLLIIALMPLKLQRLTDCVEHFTARSFFVGFLFTFLMPVVIVLVAITIVGLTVIWAVPFVYLAAFLVGIVIVGRDTGSKLLVRTLPTCTICGSTPLSLICLNT